MLTAVRRIALGAPDRDALRRAAPRAEDLVRRFDEIRRDERLDASAAEMLRDGYV